MAVFLKQEGLITLTAQRTACETWNAHPSYKEQGPVLTPVGQKLEEQGAVKPAKGSTLLTESPSTRTDA